MGEVNDADTEAGLDRLPLEELATLIVIVPLVSLPPDSPMRNPTDLKRTSRVGKYREATGTLAAAV